ncbi:uncharacterized protein LOC108629471 isoform X2 [Ceratina calcarata]|uniref:Uncharacterized protein LOC108629471 isoform X2 n=1 Tax=Ceratina calcarata TaxID=156304 RepID=A0AAJ7J8V0_9HYME|nr:uncharacterized protein LOC108629471 isoform X2 [Ceratina calcarata]
MSSLCDEEKLIELVRENSALYDAASSKYMDSQFKAKIWERIAKELNMSPSTCKTRWNNIRDAYRRCLKRQSIRSGQSGKPDNNYKFQKELAFLNSHMAVRISRSSVSDGPLVECVEEDSMTPSDSDATELQNCREYESDELPGPSSASSRKRRTSSDCGNESTSTRVLKHNNHQQTDTTMQYLNALHPLFEALDEDARLELQLSVYKKVTRRVQKYYAERKKKK